MNKLFMSEWLNTVQVQVRFKPDGHLPRPTEINLRYTFRVDEKRIRSVTYRIPIQDVEIDESDLQKSAIVSFSSATANGATTISTTKAKQAPEEDFLAGRDRPGTPPDGVHPSPRRQRSG